MSYVVYSKKHETMAALETILSYRGSDGDNSCGNNFHIALEYDDQTFIDRVRKNHPYIQCHSTKASRSFPEAINDFIRSDGEGSIIMLGPLGSFRITVEMKDKVGGFSKYLKDPYWCVEDYLQRAALAGFEEKYNIFEQVQEPMQRALNVNMYVFLWNMIGTKEEDFETFINEHYKWDDSLKEEI